MELLAGTSGFSFPEWRGSFYPEDLATDRMLAHYATRLPAVEINQTFYRLPKPDVLAGWRAEVPEGFRFVLKASRRITHVKRLRDVEEPLAFLFRSAEALEEALGAVLFQLPPNAQQNLERLETFLQAVPTGARCAFEFRHRSWNTPETHALLEARDCAWVVTDHDVVGDDPLLRTASWGYLRLREESYDDAALRAWRTRLEHCGVERAYAFFKHEDGAAGARHAARLLELAGR